MTPDVPQLSTVVDILYRKEARRLTTHLGHKLGIDAVDPAEDANHEGNLPLGKSLTAQASAKIQNPLLISLIADKREV